MKTLKELRLTAIMLLVCMMFSAFSCYDFTVIADESKQEVENQELDMPEIIEPVEVIENKYVGRLRDEEKGNLHKLVFKNEDGSKTMRVFNHPVKYIDKNGVTRDITLDIEAKTGGGFKTAANSIQTVFGKNISEGITLSHEDVSIKMVPYNIGNELSTAKETSVATLSSDKKTVRYQMTNKIAYDYSLTYTGFKEDIVVSEYTGQTSFTFILYTGGLTLIEENGSYVLVDRSDKVRATIGDVIVFTADEKNNAFGSLSYKTVKANEEYRVTIRVDGEYLKSETI